MRLKSQDAQKERDVMEMLLTEEDDSAKCFQCRKVVTLRLVLAILGAALGSFPFGYNLGSINAPESLIREFINATQHRRHGKGFPDDALTSVWALTAAIFAAGGVIGAVSAGWWATRFGRRDGSLIASSFGIVAGVFLITCRAANAYEFIIVGRFIVGIQSGLFTGLTPLYLAEISPQELRGAVGVLHQLSIVTGMLTAQILGFPVLLGTERSWHVLIGLTAIPSIIQAAILPFCPESPRYLLTTCRDRKRCREALQLLRGPSSDIQEEMDLLTSEKNTSDTENSALSIKELLVDVNLRKPLLVGVVLHLSQQVNGIPGVFFYSTRLFQDAGQSEETAKYTTSALGVVMVTMGIITVPLMDMAGRRTLMLLGLGGMAIMGTLVTFTLSLRSLVDSFEILSIIFILIFVVFFALGPAPVPWLIVPELFTHEARPAAVSVCVLVNWMGNFVVSFGFPLMQEYIKDFVFLPFVVALVLFTVFTYFRVPETKGKSFQEISAIINSSDMTPEGQHNGVKVGDMTDLSLTSRTSGSNVKEVVSEKGQDPSGAQEKRSSPSNNKSAPADTKLIDGANGEGYGSTTENVLFDKPR